MGTGSCLYVVVHAFFCRSMMLLTHFKMMHFTGGSFTVYQLWKKDISNSHYTAP